MTSSIDISAFNTTNFDAKRWINQQMRASAASGTSQSPESALSAMSLKLQLHAQDVNTTLEETLSQSIVRLPRIMLEVNRMAVEAQQLRDSLTMLLANESNEVVKSAGHDRTAMAKMHEIKTKLELCKLTLQQATYLTTNITRLDEIFRSNTPEDITAEIAKMQSALKVLEGHELHERFNRDIAGAEQRLQAMIETQCVEQLVARDTTKAKASFAMLTKIGRASGVVAKYTAHATAGLKRQWEQPATKDVSAWIESNVTMTVSLLKREATDVQQLFGSYASDVLKQLTHTVLEIVTRALTPVTAAQSLPDIVGSFQAYRPLIETCSAAEFDVVMAPFSTTFAKYGLLEEQFLMSKVSGLPWVQKLNEDTNEPLQISPALITAVSESTSQLFVWLESALNRCLSLTDGVKLGSLVASMDKVVEVFSEHMTHLGECVGSAALGGAKAAQGTTDMTLVKVVFQFLFACEALQTRFEQFNHLLVSSIQSQATLAQDSVLLSAAKDSASLRSSLASLLEAATTANHSILNADVMVQMAAATKSLVLNVISVPIDAKLKEIRSMPVWSGGDAAEGSMANFAPTEPLRAIGDILIELPMLLEAQGLDRAEEDGDDSDAITVWLEAVIERTVAEYFHVVCEMPSLSTSGAEQLGTDVEFVDNVLSAITDRKFDALVDLYNVVTAPIEDLSSVSLVTSGATAEKVKKLIGSRIQGSTFQRPPAEKKPSV
eukprot:PhM_4_TR8066/c0_g1_i2/m.80414/K20294/COG7; conserved oligomeric Golgi complex subunit 7